LIVHGFVVPFFGLEVKGLVGANGGNCLGVGVVTVLLNFDGQAVVALPDRDAPDRAGGNVGLAGPVVRFVCLGADFFFHGFVVPFFGLEVNN
jgi:hypothetical protein